MAQMHLSTKQKLIHRHRIVAAEGKEREGVDREVRVSRCKLLHLEGINNEVLLYIPGNHI